MVKDVEDGYRVSEEVEGIEPGQDSRVQKWLKDVPSSGEEDGLPLPADEPAEEPIDAEAWNAPAPELWESLSMVAEGRQKKRITRWRAQAEDAAPRREETQPLPVPEGTPSKSWKSKLWKGVKDLAKNYPAVPLMM